MKLDDPDNTTEQAKSQSNLTLDKTIGKLFVNYRVKCDVALSERNDGFYTQEDYEKAIQWELDHATQSINHLITQARKDELEKLVLDVGLFPDDIANYGGELLGKWSERKLTHSKIEDRIKEVKNSE